MRDHAVTRTWGRFWWWVFAEVSWRISCRYCFRDEGTRPCPQPWYRHTDAGYWLDSQILALAGPWVTRD